jgi:hypothetical protein
MTKFVKAEKIECSGFLFRIVWFLQFQNRNMTEATLKYLKVQGSLSMKKGGKALKDQASINSRQKD